MIAFIKAIPELIGIIVALVAWIKKVSGNDPAGLASRVNGAFTDLSKVQTPEDHANAAKNIADLIAQFPPK